MGVFACVARFPKKRGEVLVSRTAFPLCSQSQRDAVKVCRTKLAPAMGLGIDSNMILNDGRLVRRFGIVVWEIPAGKVCEAAVLAAYEAGHRHIDTVAI